MVDISDPMIESAPSSIAKGIVQATSTLDIGDTIETCQKLKIIIGRVNIIAENVSTKDSRIARAPGTQEKTREKNS